ncbi:MAG: cobalt ECF transporter T component CbiQ [Methanothrix sp.]|jgi:cobalt ABC transporter, permease protein CbiQ|uniref:Cobalt ABC transporter, inner membrane subunit CbiQ n=1 Tax=Methanothrix thermoacetophila (strain DSM 6194 / JCM 14653 / NBRC 101360 / PT) TaxID=349307 RepID=A0B6P5_METTP|nr:MULTISPECIES: cobalt ECF transporter T component CbiQ [Methanothrix]ABK14369.1 cobalt ABC transporter, inner membrane subunit CbiQ [Methanothrix thermoacetophila PT]MBC7079636.1 cobalt ECF transporter T component CbiQ [Methanothrix sp.]NPU87605.1 cobalt ECF transporter T component CbiQ [Methanothrix sp.]
MHRLLDDHAHDNGLRDVSPKLKLAIGAFSIMACIASPTPAVPLAVSACLSAAVILLARIPWRLYIGIIAIPLSFALLSASVVALLSPGEEIMSLGALSLSREGLWLGMLLVSRTIGGTSSLFFIALTTPMTEIFSILRSMGLPETLVELSMLIYRYIFVLLEEAMLVHSAQEMRMGYTSIRGSISSFAMLASVLFIRAWERGERLMVAMDSRCYSGRMPVGDDHSVRPAHLVVSAIYILSITAFLLAVIRSGLA